jgi:hypothetical protein
MDNKLDDMLIGRIYKKQLSQTKKDIERLIAVKIKNKIEAKKEEFLAKHRGQ